MSGDSEAALREAQRHWSEAPRDERDVIYLERILPIFRPMFKELPLEGAPSTMPRPEALVSILGFSWQPVALMAAWVDPERVLVIGTKASINKPHGATTFKGLIPAAAGVPAERFDWREVDDPGEEEIYREVRDFILTHQLDPHRVVLDPTGGKKSMSASAALAGFLAGIPLVYVDYREYDSTIRAPKAGSEYPRLLRNPLDVFGDVELAQVTRAFDRGDFDEARRRAEELALHLYEPREAEVFETLARAYGAWDGFRFAEASEQLERGLVMLERFGRRWTWVPMVIGRLRGHRDKLAQLSLLVHGEKPKDDELARALMANHLAAAHRARSYGNLDRAILLSYGTVERYLDWMLWSRFGLDDENPDYSTIELDRERYDRIGKVLHGKRYQSRELAGPLMLANGAQLLSALDEALFPQRLLGPLRGLMNLRNRLPVEHGLVARAVESSEAEKNLDLAGDVISLAWPGGLPALKDELDLLKFPRLRG